MRSTDERVHRTSELLGAIRVIKLYAWESLLAAQVRVDVCMRGPV